MGNFISKKTPAYTKALAALETLVRTLNEREREALFATVIQEYLEKLDGRKYGRVVTHGWAGLNWLRHKRRSNDLAHYTYEPGWRDHVEYRQNSAGMRYLLSHPYDIGHDELKDLVKYCETNNLHCHTITAESSYFPGRTVAIVLETNEQYNLRLHKDVKNGFGFTPA